MSLPFDSVSKTGYASFEYDWTDAGGTAPYSVYRDGRLAKNPDSATTYLIEGESATEPPIIEVLSSGDTSTPYTVQFPPYSVLRWHGRAGAFVYLVQQYVGSTWTQRAAIAHVGIRDYKFETLPLENGSAQQWRVLIEDLSGNRSEATLKSWTHVRAGDAPDYTTSVSSGTLTWAAA